MRTPIHDQALATSTALFGRHTAQHAAAQRALAFLTFHVQQGNPANDDVVISMAAREMRMVR